MPGVSKRFVDETLWFEFQEISETVRSYLSDVADRVVYLVIHPGSSEAEVNDKPKQLPLSVEEASSADSTKPPTTPDVGQQGRATGQAASDVDSKGRAKNKRTKSKRR